MKFLFRQRFFSWLDSYDIYDEEENPVFTVKGELAWGHCLKIFDQSGRELGGVKECVFRFLPCFEMEIDGQPIGEIQKEFTFFTPKFTLDCNGWQVEGDFFEWDYRVYDGQRLVMRAEKQLLNFTDTYLIEVEKQEDVLYALMIVLAIDAAKCSSNS